MDGVAVLLSVLAAALTGFLMHNWHPARVGFGACGALFTGFVLASAAVVTRAGQELGSGAGVLFALNAVVAADVVLVVLARGLSGRPLLRAAPDHLAHRLRRLGLTRRGRPSSWVSRPSAGYSSGLSCTSGGWPRPGPCGWPGSPWWSCSSCFASSRT